MAEANDDERRGRSMGVMDLEVQREHRVELFREAENRRVIGRRRSGLGTRVFSNLAGFLAIVR
jgi:hypothetical protein